VSQQQQQQAKMEVEQRDGEWPEAQEHFERKLESPAQFVGELRV